MAYRVDVDDPADPRLADYVRLREVSLRRHLEVEGGLFIAEGEKVVRRATVAGFAVRSFLMAPRWLDDLADVMDRAPDAPCYVAGPAVIEEVTGFHVHRGALASLVRRPLPSVSQVLGGARRVVVLEDVNDHTNVGAIFRCAAALGMDAVLLSPRCADPLYRRAIKVSMGAVFALPYTRLDDWYAGPATLAGHGFSTVALTPAPDATDLAAVPLRGKVALLLGSEGEGLSRRWLAEADVRARIPMAHGVDSLNVAAAAAVACYVVAGAA